MGRAGVLERCDFFYGVWGVGADDRQRFSSLDPIFLRPSAANI